MFEVGYLEVALATLTRSGTRRKSNERAQSRSASAATGLASAQARAAWTPLQKRAPYATNNSSPTAMVLVATTVPFALNATLFAPVAGPYAEFMYWAPLRPCSPSTRRPPIWSVCSPCPHTESTRIRLCSSATGPTVWPMYLETFSPALNERAANNPRPALAPMRLGATWNRLSHRSLELRNSTRSSVVLLQRPGSFKSATLSGARYGDGILATRRLAAAGHAATRANGSAPVATSVAAPVAAPVAVPVAAPVAPACWGGARSFDMQGLDREDQHIGHSVNDVRRHAVHKSAAQLLAQLPYAHARDPRQLCNPMYLKQKRRHGPMDPRCSA